MIESAAPVADTHAQEQHQLHIARPGRAVLAGLAVVEESRLDVDKLALALGEELRVSRAHLRATHAMVTSDLKVARQRLDREDAEGRRAERQLADAHARHDRRRKVPQRVLEAGRSERLTEHIRTDRGD